MTLKFRKNAVNRAANAERDAVYGYFPQTHYEQVTVPNELGYLISVIK